MSNQLRGVCPSHGTRSSSKALSPYKQPIELYRKLTSVTPGKLTQSIDAKLIAQAEELKLEQDFQKNFTTEADLKFLADCSKSGDLSQQLSLFKNVSVLEEGWKSMLYAMDLKAGREVPQQEDAVSKCQQQKITESNKQTATGEQLQQESAIAANKAAETAATATGLEYVYNDSQDPNKKTQKTRRAAKKKGNIRFELKECSIPAVSLCQHTDTRNAQKSCKFKKKQQHEDMEFIKSIVEFPKLVALVEKLAKINPRSQVVTKKLVNEEPAIALLKSSVNDHRGSGDGIHIVMISNDKRKSAEDEYDCAEAASLPADLRVIPMESDFRNYFELDTESLGILSRYANMSINCADLGESNAAAINFTPDRRITCYLMYLYRLRIVHKLTTLHAAIKEGLFAAQTLTQQPNLLNSLLSKSQQLPNRSKLFKAHLKLDKLHKAELSSNRKPASMAINGLTAYYMVTSYLQMLLEKATNQSLPILERHLFLCHYAVAVLEKHINSLNKDVPPASISCKQLLLWCYLKEGSVENSINMALSIANLRSKLSTANIYALRMPNSQAYLRFKEQKQLPYPYKLGIDPRVPRIRRYELAEHNFPFEYYCPIAGCTAALCASNFMAHFVTDHCSRVEELWLYDRTMLLFHKQCYAQDQNHCISILALLPRKPLRLITRPLRVLNYQLPSSQLYFAEHWPCMLMYRSMHSNRDEPGTEPKFVDVFWVASINEFPSHLGVTLNISVKSKALEECLHLDVVHMSDFKSEEHLLQNHKRSYVAFEHGMIEKATDNFEEVLFVNIRYINKHDYSDGFEQNEKYWDYDDLAASGINMND